MADKKQQAYDYFVGQGWSPAQASAIVGGAIQESSLDHTKYGDNGQAYGLFQWHADRQSEFLLKTGKTIQNASFEDQLAFAQYELTQGKEKAAGTALAQTTTLDSAATVFASKYERPTSTDYTPYINNAKDVFSSAAVTATSGFNSVLAKIKAGQPVTFDDLQKVFSAPVMAAGGVVGAAGQATADAAKNALNFNIGEWLVNLISGGTVWASFKDHLIPIGVGIIAALLVAFSAWGMIKDTTAGTIIKTGAKTAALI